MFSTRAIRFTVLPILAWVLSNILTRECLTNNERPDTGEAPAVFIASFIAKMNIKFAYLYTLFLFSLRSLSTFLNPRAQ